MRTITDIKIEGQSSAKTWAHMLVSMYINWINKDPYKRRVENIFDLVYHGSNDGGFIIIFTHDDPSLADRLQYEIGVHRLVRIEEDGLRQTSFAKVSINDIDLRTVSGNTRNYILDPYGLAKDPRTGYCVDDVHSVLNGDLDGFMDAYAKRMKGSYE